MHSFSIEDAPPSAGCCSGRLWPLVQQRLGTASFLASGPRIAAGAGQELRVWRRQRVLVVAQDDVEGEEQRADLLKVEFAPVAAVTKERRHTPWVCQLQYMRGS